MRCIGTGRKCDGYTRGHPLGSNIVAPPPRHNNARSSPLWDLALPSQFLLDEREQRCFRFFRHRTVAQLSGFFVSEFWNYRVLQIFNHEPAIKHAVIALGSLHERFEQGGSFIKSSNADIEEGGFALEQYIKAIHQLIKPPVSSKRLPVDVCLVACILFACFEVCPLRFSFLASKGVTGKKMGI